MSQIFEETKSIMNEYHIKANKNLGQNFLISEEVVNSIINASEINKEDLIIEIGPGLGTLTKYLLEKAGKVICIELDKNMIKILQNRFTSYKNFELLNQDILKVDLQNLIYKEKINTNIKKIKIVANLPYYITTPIIMKLLEDKLDLESITVMIQKEVADRLIAIPGDKQAGAITYSVYYYAQVQEILEVPKSSFIPEPQVTSKVIKMQIRKKAPVEVEDSKKMFNLIKCAFMQRRKTLLNSLLNSNIFKSKEEGLSILEKLKINNNARPENLKLEDYANMSKLI